jgi:hypothetical protein
MLETSGKGSLDRDRTKPSVRFWSHRARFRVRIRLRGLYEVHEFYRDVTGRTCGRLICDRPSFLRLNSAANTLCWTPLRSSRIA